MPTPYGSRGGMAFSADELRVLRGALAVALQPAAAPAAAGEPGEYLRLAESLDEAVREGSRLRSFLLADLARYRAALPGAAAGYLEQLEDALAAGYLPRPDDLAALRLLCGEPSGEREAKRRAELLRRGERLAEQAVRARLLVLPGGRSAGTTARAGRGVEGAPGGSAEAESGAAADAGAEAASDAAPERSPAERPDERPAPAPSPSAPSPAPAEPRSPRPVPTPAEVFPPRRRGPDPGDPDPDAAPDPAPEGAVHALPA
ncbi:hypothetical protein [Streptomyces phytohabitans]|uniref:hypothetical protein n=1 Tax=Streptomyces phytohabitans TaxID=1150371 RepID=UPI00345B96E2